MIAHMLEKRGHYVRAVEDGRDVLTALEQETFDLILMDLQMPILDGLATTTAIREAERGTSRHIPIVALTAHAVRGDKGTLSPAGDGWLHQQADPDVRAPGRHRAARSALRRPPRDRGPDFRFHPGGLRPHGRARALWKATSRHWPRGCGFTWRTCRLTWASSIRPSRWPTSALSRGPLIVSRAGSA